MGQREQGGGERRQGGTGIVAKRGDPGRSDGRDRVHGGSSPPTPTPFLTKPGGPGFPGYPVRIGSTGRTSLPVSPLRWGRLTAVHAPSLRRTPCPSSGEYCPSPFPSASSPVEGTTPPRPIPTADPMRANATSEAGEAAAEVLDDLGEKVDDAVETAKVEADSLIQTIKDYLGEKKSTSQRPPLRSSRGCRTSCLPPTRRRSISSADSSRRAAWETRRRSSPTDSGSATDQRMFSTPFPTWSNSVWGAAVYLEPDRERSVPAAPPDRHDPQCDRRERARLHPKPFVPEHLHERGHRRRSPMRPRARASEACAERAVDRSSFSRRNSPTS